MKFLTIDIKMLIVVSLIVQLSFKLEPCGIDFWQLVGIGFLLKCRFSVGIGFGLGIEKSCRFFGFSFFSDFFFVTYICVD
jgi:hypothetical protein